jgi:hypothetical protein
MIVESSNCMKKAIATISATRRALALSGLEKASFCGVMFISWMVRRGMLRRRQSEHRTAADDSAPV